MFHFHTRKKNFMKLIDDFKKHNYFYNKILIDVILFFIPFLGIYLFIYSFLNYFSILNIYTYEDFMFFYEETSFEGFLDVDYWWFFYIFSTFILSILSIVFFIKRYKIRNIERPKYLFQLIMDVILFIFSLLGFGGTGFLIKEHYWKFDGGVIVENLYLFDFFIFSIVIVLTLLFSIYFYFRMIKRFKTDKL